MSRLEANKSADLSAEEHAAYEKIKKTVDATMEKMPECANLSSTLAPEHMRAI
jgi:hypothetical protein